MDTNMFPSGHSFSGLTSTDQIYKQLFERQKLIN